MNLNVSEAEFQTAVIDLAKRLGWHVHHSPRSMVRGRPMTAIVGHPGLPDLVLARDGVVLLAELKRHGGRATPGQLDWLSAAGEHGRLWTPLQWPAIVDELSGRSVRGHCGRETA